MDAAERSSFQNEMSLLEWSTMTLRKKKKKTAAMKANLTAIGVHVSRSTITRLFTRDVPRRRAVP